MDPGGIPVREVLVENIAFLWDQGRIKVSDNGAAQLPRFHRVDQQELDVLVIPLWPTKISYIHLDLVRPRCSPFLKFFKKTFLRPVLAFEVGAPDATIHSSIPEESIKRINFLSSRFGGRIIGETSCK